ncbi:GGDEF domain-containing protein [Colwellia sp. Arc7-635]|uniref:GGDEF domain-containing protein n=1 Tax=Colwellia sp. Arc7-635 TaxID=2497879 RepID=UPI000F851BA3|nr:GGDEF domain-containing protein [Colwellia sp. Arc7-635]AZQ86034.1 GGDEF domain-containing protein [Colwellia sp. Arc7-635]
MKYHDSVAQAEQKMHVAIKQLQLWHIPATPINYAVSYNYLSKNSPALNTAIEKQLATRKKLDNFFLEEVYRQYILGQSAFRGELIDDLDEVLFDLQTNSEQSSVCTNRMVNQLDNNISSLKSTDKREVINAIKQIRQTTQHFKLEQEKLAKKLRLSQQSTDALRGELDDVKKEIYLDPLTGLYNRKAMSKHLDMWLSDDPTKQIAAIVVSIDHFSGLNERFGPVISDVLLTKIANKVSSYVGESGLPVRSAGDEFLILLPNIERDVAGEIAEKIRQSVEKLRFVSSKSGARLPPVTLSMGVSDYNVSTSANNIISQTRELLSNISNTLTNHVNIAQAQTT